MHKEIRHSGFKTGHVAIAVNPQNSRLSKRFMCSQALKSPSNIDKAGYICPKFLKYVEVRGLNSYQL